MTKRLTKRFIIKNINNLDLSDPIRYERYYINDNLRIQKKNDNYEKEILDNNNVLVEKIKIDLEEFISLKENAYKEIVRDSYLLLNSPNISIKKYYGIYEGLFRVEVSFNTEEEMINYQKEDWMNEDITDSPLAFDKYLSKLTKEEFLKELSKFNKEM